MSYYIFSTVYSHLLYLLKQLTIKKENSKGGIIIEDNLKKCNESM